MLVCTGVSLQLRGVILPICLFLGRITLSGLVLMMVHRRFVGSLALNILSMGTTDFDLRWIAYQLGYSNNHFWRYL